MTEKMQSFVGLVRATSERVEALKKIGYLAEVRATNNHVRVTQPSWVGTARIDGVARFSAWERTHYDAYVIAAKWFAVEAERLMRTKTERDAR